MIKVFLADDHKLFADGIALILNNLEEVELVGYAPNGKEVIRQLESLKVDIILLDLSMPELDGEATLELLRKLHPEVKILILTTHDEGAYISHFMDLNVDGYLLKNTEKEELLNAIKTIDQGKTYFPSAVVSKAVSFTKTAREAKQKEEVEDLLTEREQEIVVLTAKDHTIPKIAEILKISPNTVKSHRKNIQHKLEVANQNGIIKYAIEKGLV